jgi:hypothetical protein
VLRPYLLDPFVPELPFLLNKGTKNGKDAVLVSKHYRLTIWVGTVTIPQIIPALDSIAPQIGTMDATYVKSPSPLKWIMFLSLIIEHPIARRPIQYASISVTRLCQLKSSKEKRA